MNSRHQFEDAYAIRTICGTVSIILIFLSYFPVLVRVGGGRGLWGTGFSVSGLPRMFFLLGGL